MSKSKKVDLLIRKVHRKFGFSTNDILVLKYNGFELGEQDKDVTIDDLIDEEGTNELEVDCSYVKAGIPGKDFVLRNATNSELAIAIVYKIKESSQQRGFE